MAWLSTYEVSCQSTAQMKRVALLRTNLDILPDQIRRCLRRYYRIRLIPVLFLVVMTLAGLLSNVIGHV